MNYESETLRTFSTTPQLCFNYMPVQHATIGSKFQVPHMQKKAYVSIMHSGEMMIMYSYELCAQRRFPRNKKHDVNNNDWTDSDSSFRDRLTTDVVDFDIVRLSITGIEC